MTGEGKLCLLALWALLALLGTCSARYLGPADEEESLEDMDVQRIRRGMLQPYLLEDPVAEAQGFAREARRTMFRETQKKSKLNRLVALLMRRLGQQYHYNRVTPVRFGGGRR